MRKKLSLVTLLIVSMTALTLMPALAQQDSKPGHPDEDEKFVRMGKNAIPGQYIVLMDLDAAGPRGDLFSAARMTSDLT
ncbi:MAG: hypothetical protein WAV20_07040, partial [Blastocatellia bacterium]